MLQADAEYPTQPHPSTAEDLSGLRRWEVELTRQLKAVVSKERAARPSRCHQRYLDRVIDVIELLACSLEGRP